MLRKTLSIVLSLFLCVAPLFGLNNGTIVGSPSFTAQKFSTGLSGATDSNYISCPAGVTAAMVGTFSYDMWFKRASAPAALELFFGIGSDWYGISSGGAFAYAQGSLGANTVGSVADNALHHVMISVTTNNFVRIFIDGTLAVSSAGTFPDPGSGGCTIGRPTFTGNPFAGGVDEFAMWSIDHTVGSVPSSAYTGSESGLIALYHLNGDATDSKVGGPTAPANRAGAHISGGNFAY